MQTSSYESRYWQLFKSVQPLFASDIPWEVQDGSQEDVAAKIAIENIGDLIKACMMEIPIHVQIEHFDTLDGFALFIADDLRPLLSTLQEFLRDEVMKSTTLDTVSMGIILLLYWQIRILLTRNYRLTTPIKNC